MKISFENDFESRVKHIKKLAESIPEENAQQTVASWEANEANEHNNRGERRRQRLFPDVWKEPDVCAAYTRLGMMFGADE